jgi:hypothetical protein
MKFTVDDRRVMMMMMGSSGIVLALLLCALPLPCARAQTTSLLVGPHQTCLHDGASLIVCAGTNAHGVLGRDAVASGATEHSFVAADASCPARLGAAARVSALVVGERSACALCEAERSEEFPAVVCWGNNSRGQGGSGAGCVRAKGEG